MNAHPPEKLPWQPLFSIERGGKVEQTIYGILYGWAEDKTLDNAGKTLIKLGDIWGPIWTRSLLKPWQFLVIYPTLKEHYPQLNEQHFALMIASHNGDLAQISLLHEMMAIGGFREDDLKCSACQPMGAANRQSGVSEIYNPCAGKHLGYLLYDNAKGYDTRNYLDPASEPYKVLKELIAYLLSMEPEELAVSTDGCGMPNIALGASEIGQLYHALLNPMQNDVIRRSPDEVEKRLEHWNDVAELMQHSPEIVGGRDRLDTKLMRELSANGPVIAKEGADGLLALAIGSCPTFKDGAGFLVKLAGGYDATHLETIIRHVLSAYGLSHESPARGEVKPVFHFELNPVNV